MDDAEQRLARLEKEVELLRAQTRASRIAFGAVWNAFEAIAPGIQDKIMQALLEAQQRALQGQDMHLVAAEIARLVPSR